MRSAVSRARARLGLVVMLVLSALAPAAAAAAQEDPSATTTTSTTSTTVAPPPPDPGPAPTTPPAAPAPLPPGPAPDAVPEGAPPPLGAPLPPPPPPSPRDVALDRALYRMTNQQRKHMVDTKLRVDESAARLTAMHAKLDLMEARLAEARAVRDRAAERLFAAKRTLKDRAVAAYTGERLSLLSALLDARDLSELSRRSEMIDSVVRADRKAITSYRDSRERFEEEAAALAAATEEERKVLQQEEKLQAELTTRLENLRTQMTAFRGIRLSLGEFVFPVEPPYAYGDSWGAPRMLGTEYAHYHQGIDIFAPTGTPLRACVRGMVTKMGSDVLGGIKLWVVGEDGTAYYYAHLSAFADGVHEGQVVEPGQVLGYVGDTGNAKGGLPHLHFEIHPGGGDAINPYPVLKAVDDADQAVLVGTAPPPTPPPLTGAG